MTKEEHGIRFFEILGKELPASLLTYKLAMEKKEAESVLKDAVSDLSVEQNEVSEEALQEEKQAHEYFKSEAEAARLSLTAANERTLELVDKFYTEDMINKYAPTGNRNAIRDTIYVLGDIRDMENIDEDGTTFIAVYSLVNKMSHGRFYTIWDGGKWAQDMSTQLPPPNGYEWKKLDLAVSNKYWITLTEIAIDIVYNKDNKERDKVKGVFKS